MSAQFCPCGNPITYGRSRCRSCAARMVKVRNVQPSPKITYGKPAKPSPCPFSWWAELPEFFYEKAKVRASETKGRERISE